MLITITAPVKFSHKVLEFLTEAEYCLIPSEWVFIAVNHVVEVMLLQLASSCDNLSYMTFVINKIGVH